MSEKEILRNQARRLGVIRHFEEVSRNISKTCRYFGISGAAFYRWRNRYQHYGAQDLRDRSRRPLNSPRTTQAEIIAKIIYLRETYHLGLMKRSFIVFLTECSLMIQTCLMKKFGNGKPFIIIADLMQP